MDLRKVLKGDMVVRRPSCNVVKRSMKTARHDMKMRIVLTPVKPIGNHDQKSTEISLFPASLLG
jgi:hypothetical protein